MKIWQRWKTPDQRYPQRKSSRCERLGCGKAGKASRFYPTRVAPLCPARFGEGLRLAYRIIENVLVYTVILKLEFQQHWNQIRMVRMNTWDPPKTPCFQQAIDPETGAPRGGSNPQTDPSWEAGLPNKLLCGKDSSLYQYLCFFFKRSHRMPPFGRDWSRTLFWIFCLDEFWANLSRATCHRACWISWRAMGTLVRPHCAEPNGPWKGHDTAMGHGMPWHNETLRLMVAPRCISKCRIAHGLPSLLFVNHGKPHVARFLEKKSTYTDHVGRLPDSFGPTDFDDNFPSTIQFWGTKASGNTQQAGMGWAVGGCHWPCWQLSSGF